MSRCSLPTCPCLLETTQTFFGSGVDTQVTSERQVGRSGVKHEGKAAKLRRDEVLFKENYSSSAEEENPKGYSRALKLHRAVKLGGVCLIKTQVEK